MDTIVAVSSGRPPAAIAVIRVSGPAALAAVGALAGSLPPPRRAALRALRDAGGRLLDRALVLTFAGPASATGEDLVEVHCHGGRAVVDAVERALLARPGVRSAEAGEFTRRALLNGRIDLAQAEGLADLLSAETERQRRAAIDAAEGQVSARVRGWMDRAALIGAEIEARLDFADEDDVAREGGSSAAQADAMRVLGQDIAAAIDAPSVDRLRDGVRVVIAGPPNSGKSTLINALAERDVAIVTPIAGTTRDRIEVPVARDGIPYVLTDTAGLTETDDVVERIGVGRSIDAMATADIVVWMGDDSPPEGALWLHARADLAGRRSKPAGPELAVARNDGAAVGRVWDAIAVRAGRILPAGDQLAFTRWQQQQCRTAAAALLDPPMDDLIAAEQVRVALRSLAAITGAGATDLMLSALFGRFCIGK